PKLTPLFACVQRGHTSESDDAASFLPVSAAMVLRAFVFGGWAFLAGAMGSCAVSAVSEEGKACPCSEPSFVCCGGTCQASDVECEVTTPASCEGDVRINNLRVTWATPNAIRFDWDVEERPDDPVVAYELRLAPDAASLENDRDVERYNAARNPELGFFRRPRETERALVNHTVADGLEPGRTFAVALSATDGAGDVCRVTLDAARTNASPNPAEFVLYTEGNPPGWEEPSCFSPSNERPQAGESHLRYSIVCQRRVSDEGIVDGVATCDDVAETVDSCGVLVKLGQLDLPVPLAPGSFAGAYVEFHTRVPGVETFYGFVNLIITTEDGARQNWLYEPYSHRSGDGYQRLQVPLRAFLLRGTDASRPMTADDLVGGMINQFFVGGTDQRHSSVFDVDEVRIRWQ
ncbi:MAG: hypothetical protein AAF645_29605, partial [Myxococcota bacterium]